MVAIDITAVNKQWELLHKQTLEVEDVIKDYYYNKVDELFNQGMSSQEVKEFCREIPNECVVKVLVFHKILLYEQTLVINKNI
jgi:hypothetical protein